MCRCDSEALLRVLDLLALRIEERPSGALTRLALLELLLQLPHIFVQEPGCLFVQGRSPGGMESVEFAAM